MMNQNEKEQFDPKKLIWEKCFEKICCATIISLILTVILFVALVALCPIYTEWMQEKEYRFVRIVFPLMLLIALAEVLVVMAGKKENKLSTVRFIVLANALAAIVFFMALKKAIGGHATTYEESAYRIFLINMIVHIVAGVACFKTYREIEIASEGENNGENNGEH